MIDYGLIHTSIDFYAKTGFKRVESPWTVTKAVSEITRPSDKPGVFFMPSNLTSMLRQKTKLEDE